MEKTCGQTIMRTFNIAPTLVQNKTFPLSADHHDTLRHESAISDEVIEQRGYRTITDVNELKKLGFSKRQLRVPGLLIPLYGTDGGQPFCIYRPDNPWRDKGGKARKYEFPYGQSMRLDVPPACREAIKDPSVPLWIVEGQKKGDALVSAGARAVIVLLGVDCIKGKNEFGGKTFLNDWGYVALNNRVTYVVFDSDLLVKVSVRGAVDRATTFLQSKGACVKPIYLPHTDGKKCGVDDFLAAGHTLDELEKLAEG